MKYEIYKQMPIAPAIGIGATGTDVFTLSPSPTIGAISKVKAIYIDLPADVTLNINLSTITGNDDINSPGNEAGSIVFRTGIEFATPITITVVGTAGTAYGVKIVTEVEIPTVQDVNIANFPETIDVNVTNFPDPQRVEVTNFPGQPQIAQAGLGWFLIGGLVVGAIYASTRKKEERITIR